MNHDALTQARRALGQVITERDRILQRKLNFEGDTKLHAQAVNRKNQQIKRKFAELSSENAIAICDVCNKGTAYLHFCDALILYALSCKLGVLSITRVCHVVNVNRFTKFWTRSFQNVLGLCRHARFSNTCQYKRKKKKAKRENCFSAT